MTTDPAQTATFGYRTRRNFKEFVQSLPTKRDAIVVASFGRAGSTLVYDAVAEAMAQHRYHAAGGLSLKVAKDEAFDLGARKLRPGVVYKTHDYPDVLSGKKNVRALFLFGSAEEAALSVHAQKAARSEDWVKLHFEHLRRPYRYDDLLQEDVLGFRDQCVAWMSFEGVPVLCLRYEGLWDNIDTISEFCGLDVRLPKRRERAPKKVEPEALERARAVYGPLDNELAKLPDCFVASPEFGSRLKLRDVADTSSNTKEAQ
ncbi:hypothetical protein [Allosediminivita pacifica]|uniref:Sulfotransferase family protein n=1 Tax=Allosediminivita pacifica TaxID=1267769 RepID=A0A2T6A955_9RHOB|nr:hypothetical protein [Allosediminivita pacifica]PTX40354.1 hypothetical protein C8N44_1349 [Allosediminivita pacifica]GGB26460.1 hypothetical protein GCM10011324_40340 [Allosediminivita pacifica]